MSLYDFELYPDNDAEFTIVPTTGTGTIVTGLTVILEIRASLTATAAIGTMTYTAAGNATGYTVIVNGGDITTNLSPGYIDTNVFAVIYDAASSFKGYLNGVVRATRQLQ